MAAAPAVSINKHDKNQYSVSKLWSLLDHLHFFFPFSIEESHQFLLSSSLIKILEVPLNIDWLQESIWFYYLTLPCWLWCEHSSGRCSSSSETLELKGFLIKCLFSSWDLLPRKERLEFPGHLSRAGKVCDSWECLDAVLASGSMIHNLTQRELSGPTWWLRDVSLLRTAASWEGPEGKTALHTFSILATVIPN